MRPCLWSAQPSASPALTPPPHSSRGRGRGRGSPPVSCWRGARRSGLVLLVGEEEPPELVGLQRGRGLGGLEALGGERRGAGRSLGPKPKKGLLGGLLVVREPRGARNGTARPQPHPVLGEGPVVF